MIVTEKDIEKKVLICYVCDKPLEVGDRYETIKTKRKSKLIIHTDCICGKGESNER